MDITIEWISLGGTVAILVFLWGIHRDMGALSDRVSRLEGRMAGVESQISMLVSMFVQKKETTTT